MQWIEKQMRAMRSAYANRNSVKRDESDATYICSREEDLGQLEDRWSFRKKDGNFSGVRKLTTSKQMY